MKSNKNSIFRKLKNYYKYRKNYKIVKKSNLFNEEYYLKNYPDVKNSKIEPITHFIKFGAKEGRNPSDKFDTKYYLSMNRDINPKKINPLVHYIKFGKKEGRACKTDSYFKRRTEYTYHKPTLSDDVKVNINSFEIRPLISIIMPVYNVDSKWIHLAIKSLEEQWYEKWELCIADDNSTKKETKDYLKQIDNEKIKITFLEDNLNISGASNEALKFANGEYIALMDNDDELTPDALYEIVKAINTTNADFIYSDEDKIEMDGTFSEPHFKPDFSFDMFLSTNYISHLGVVKKILIEQIGGWEIGLEGSQDYDLYLKIIEQTNKIYHIPKVLYHWRKIPGSTASEYGEKSYAHQAGKKALENHLFRSKIKGKVEDGVFPGTYRVRNYFEKDTLVSIIIPFKDKPELLKQCIESIINLSSYKNFEIIGISNNSENKSTFKEMARLQKLDKRVKFFEYNEPFNYSAINNHAVENYSNGTSLVFLNNDVEILTPDWLESMLEISVREKVGAVGVKLYYENETIQHAGVLVNVFDTAVHAFLNTDKTENGYFSRLRIINNYSAVTAACMMIRKEVFEKVNGFDEVNFKIAYNDVDLCLKLLESGYRNVFTPYVEAYHYESISRGKDNENIDKIIRLKTEQYNLHNFHNDFFSKDDPFYNKNLTNKNIDFSLSPLVTHDRDYYLPIEFEEDIIKSIACNEPKYKSIVVFSHFDKDNVIDNYVINYLKELSSDRDIVFVSTAENLKIDEIDKISDYCHHVIVKSNIGYDFGAWKTGLDFLSKSLTSYDELILCNDSVYGPFYSLDKIHKKMFENKYDIWAMSKNYEKKEHLQSYYMVYNKKAFSSQKFKLFWKNLKMYNQKDDIIINNEIEFSNSFILDNKFKVGSFLSYRNNACINRLHYDWNQILVEEKFPFIKIELLRDNPLKLDIENWEYIVGMNSNYPISIIKDHLKRFNKKEN